MTKLTTTILLSLFLSWSNPLTSQSNLVDKQLSSVVFQINFKSPGFRGFGGYLALVNTESKEIFRSTIKIGFRPFIVVEDLPVGNYQVMYLDIITGGPSLFLEDKELFNLIEIKEQKNYYLGNYVTKKIKPIFKLHVNISKDDDDSSEKIYKKIGKINDKWKDLEIDFDQSLLKEDSVNVIIKR